MTPVLLAASVFGVATRLSFPADPQLARPVAAPGVEARVSATPSCPLLLSYDFHGVAGWAGVSWERELELPANFVLHLELSGSGPPNRLEVKLKQGENVHWYLRNGFVPTPETTELLVPRRRFRFAWGPRPDTPLTALSGLEVVLAAESGGRGELCVEELVLEAREEAEGEVAPKLTASSSAAGRPAVLAMDGDPATFWRSDLEAAPALTLAFPEPALLSGLATRWGPDPPKSLRVAVQRQGAWHWQAPQVPQPGSITAVPLPAEPIAAVRLELVPFPGAPVSVAELVVQEEAPPGDLTWGWHALAQGAPRGTFPRGFVGEQVYWTVTGLPDGQLKVVVSEDGAAEVDAKGVSLEPMVEVGGRLYTWADVTVSRSLAEGFLPLPEVRWQGEGFTFRWQVRVTRYRGKELVLAQGELANIGDRPLSGKLFLLLRPFRVTPPWATLNLPPASPPVPSLTARGPRLQVGERMSVVADEGGPWRVSDFPNGEVGLWLRSHRLPVASSVVDAAGAASAVLPVPLQLPAGERRSVRVAVAAEGELPEELFATAWPVLWEQPLRVWQRAVDGLAVVFPSPAGEVGPALKANLAFMLLHRQGPALQPGSRNYARAWIRDAYGMGLALLRSGHSTVVRDFLHYYAGFQFPDGQIPCCVDRRGADPVPEHDSHGQFLALLADYTRYAGETATALSLWPRVEATAAALFRLRASRLSELYEKPQNQRFFGLLPPSISHEGYSAHPVHSYWDDFWALRGLADAADLARSLGFLEEAVSWEQKTRAFAADLAASMRLVQRHERSPYVPASADLADFDPTSSAIAWNLDLVRGFFQDLPWAATFKRYLQNLDARLEGAAWTDYTPYEARIAAALFRMGSRQGGWRLLRSLLEQRRPEGWLGWPEVITREARVPRFVGDMPHAWVGAEFVNAVFDAVAYPQGQRLVVAAGLPEAWLSAGERLHLGPLATPWGWITVRASGERDKVIFELSGASPPEGVVLAWPWGGEVRVDGGPVSRQEHGVVVWRLPAVVEIRR